jgi:hypothetical protein
MWSWAALFTERGRVSLSRYEAETKWFGVLYVKHIGSQADKQCGC